MIRDANNVGILRMLMMMTIDAISIDNKDACTVF